jgi:hypothetical protein
MANLPDTGVARKIYSSEYPPRPAVKFFARLDLDQICPFLDGHSLTMGHSSNAHLSIDGDPMQSACAGNRRCLRLQRGCGIFMIDSTDPFFKWSKENSVERE